MGRWKGGKERFWAKVRKSDGCWLWTGCCSDTGYGCVYDGRAYAAHRYSWLIHFGVIPDGLCVLHRCDVRACVRPDHLWLGTKAENSRDMAGKGRNLGPDNAGENHGEAKLTEADVRLIRGSAASGVALAARLGVSPSLVSLVRRRKAWTHL